ncbi:MAG: FtsX-like permease family protein [Candidatus Palauibacterales bacterium]|nr:FtsX-like permease family protein [Candidatus Palauibacterales bacterium]MDP2584436.1 FtsX-like permease family protein [Candidatus Palauibacterales bacterium]
MSSRIGGRGSAATGGPRTAAAALGLAAGASGSVLGLLALASWWPPRLAWAVRAATPPDGGWFGGWSPDLRTAASLQGSALSAALGVAAGLALLALAAGFLHVCLSLLSDAVERQPEWALRAALGASERRLRRERLAEGLELAATAAAVAVPLGWAGRLALRRLAPPVISFVSGAHAPDAHAGLPAALFLAVVCAGVVLAALPGAARREILRHPARRIADLVGPRTGGGRGVSAGAGGAAGWLLAAAQVGAALIVTVAALILVRGAPAVAADARAYPDATDTLLLRVRLPEALASAEVWTDVRRRLLDLPGVEQAAVSSPGALLGLGPVDRVASDCPWCTGGGMFTGVMFGLARYEAVGPGYFDLLRGHGTAAARGRRGAALPAPAGPERGTVTLDRAFTGRLFQGRDPAGRTVWLADRRAKLDPGLPVGATVDVPRPVGLGTGGAAVPTLFVSALDRPPSEADVALRVEPGIDPRGSGEAALRSVAEAAPGSRAEALGTLAGLLDGRVRVVGWLAGLTAALSLVCLLLAVRAVAATLNARVRARRAEIGLRRALGARRLHVARLVAADAGRLVAVGTAAGVLIATGVERGLPLLVRGVAPLSPATILGLALGLACLALGTAALAAWRVTGDEPARAL